MFVGKPDEILSTVTVVFFFHVLLSSWHWNSFLYWSTTPPFKDQITNAVKAQVLPGDYDWREEDPRLTDFTEPINVTFEVPRRLVWVSFRLIRFLWMKKLILRCE